MLLTSIVKLYRSFENPPIENGRFSKRAQYSQNIMNAINDVREHSPELIKELLINGDEILSNNPLPESGIDVEITVQLPANSAERFYESVSSLLELPEVSRGKMPAKYYIYSIDYFSEERANKPLQVEMLERVCLLIECLSSLAHYHDDKIKNNHFKLVFVQPNKEQQREPTIIETKIEESLLDTPPFDISIVESLCDVSAETDPHYTAKIGVLWNTLSEFIHQKGGEQSSFSYLVMNWKVFVSTYQQNLATYISGFAFHKAKKEVAEEEVAMADKFSKVFNDITGRLYSIPLSFAALIAVAKLESPFESLVVTLGLLVASLIIVGSVDNQQNQLKSVKRAKELMFEALDGKKDEFPQPLNDSITKMKQLLNSNEKKLVNLLVSFRVLGWLPVILGVAIYVYLYGAPWFSWSYFILAEVIVLLIVCLGSALKQSE